MKSANSNAPPLRVVTELDPEVRRAAEVLAERKLVPVAQAELEELRGRVPLAELRSAIKAAVREELASFFATSPVRAASTPIERRWMTLGEYRASRAIAERTLQAYISEGLPTVGEGRGRRVVVAEADAWLARRMGRAAGHER